MSNNTNNPNKTLLLILILFIVHLSAAGGFFSAEATIRYVSHSGSNTPPYTSWATAADSIMSAINISVFGDTIYVANGVYEEKVVMIAGLSLIGIGSDSCIIDTRNFSAPQAVGVNSNCLLKNFRIIVQNSAQTLGQGIVIGSPNSIIEYNEVLNARSAGIWCYNTNSIVRHNKIYYCDDAISIEFNQPTIDSNYIFTVMQGGTFDGVGIRTNFSTKPTIRGNIIVFDSTYITAAWTGFLDYSSISILENNLFYGRGENGIMWAFSDTIKNNMVYGKWGGWEVGMSTSSSIVKNNHIEKTLVGLSAGGTYIVRYNNLWDNDINFPNFSPDSTNIFTNPMFVNEDSLDFHLQMFSPLIDAGDPNILDVDGSRSDIGLYGGPFGKSYTYLDLPPRPPVNLTAEVDSNYITLSWNRNTEADFSHYSLFRDTTANFTADSTTFVLTLSDTFYTHIIPEGVEALYYKLTATDFQGNQSSTSEELAVIITTINKYPTTINSYKLYQNYPNPFNPSTKIGYKLKERGHVKLYVYDIKGELVEVLVNKVQDAGYYEVNFDVKSQKSKVRSDLASGIYIYQIHVISEKNIPVFTDIKKMVYIK